MQFQCHFGDVAEEMLGDFLRKFFRFMVLFISTIVNLQLGMKYLFNNHVLDVGARNLLSAGRPIHVEPQVFDLIVYLIENRARVVDRDELIARIWKGRTVSDATIASRINAARQAVGDSGRRQAVIATLARQGFRFVAEVRREGETLGRPAVAVLPFALASDTDLDAHLAKGLADQLASTLGQASWFDVRDTSASFAPMLQDLGPAEIADRLDVGYLVSATLHVSPEQLKLDVRLVDPNDGRRVWSGSLAAPRSGLFALQDDLGSRILGEIEPRLRKIELQRSEDRHGNLSAFHHFLRANDILRAMDLAAMRAACVELDKAVSAFPRYAAAHGMRAWIATLLLPQGQRVDIRAELERSRIAVTEGAFDCDALAMGGYALAFFDRHPACGIDYLRRALAINPSSARAHDHLGWLLLYAGQAGEAWQRFDRALSLCPIDDFGFRSLTGRAFASLYQRDFKNAAVDAYRAHAVAPSYSVCHRVLAASLAHLGRGDDARRIARELSTLNPGLTVARYARETRFEGVSDREILFSGLKLAGLK
ncbi:winged helix-turn-helix domain-containing protein [Defluviimonas sp. WL0050]|uniref:Winged helix-turn-helix domain-containing protein n=1 Tax=Albidovulum litorale TaxID=2984134 RepID=A0ABT2ZT91_9RHOB|nr:winged helix-turn-helix domain-containing protein [Defluviimonas sp. WL0050]